MGILRKKLLQIKDTFSSRFFQILVLNSQLQKGFTIIELLVVITLVGVVSGVGIFSLVNYGNTQTIEQAVSNIKGIFEEAKFNAISSVRISMDDDGQALNCAGDLTSYRVDIIPSSEIPDRFVLFMECEGGFDQVRTYALPNNVDLGVETTCDEITYESVDLVASELNGLPCYIEVVGFGQEKLIEIDELGNVRI